MDFHNIEYFLILISLLAVTLIIEKANKIHLYKNRRERLEIISLFFIIGVIWDSFAIWRGHWIFPASGNIGITIGLMPIEEYLFILIIPYTVLTIYKLIDSRSRKS